MVPIDVGGVRSVQALENILGGARKYDVWAVNEDAEYAESGYSGVEDALKSERLTPRRVAA